MRLRYGFLSFQFNNRYSGTTELNVFVVEMFDKRQGAKILSDQRAQYTVACTVQNAQLVDIAHHGIVDEIANGLHSLLASHTAYINIGTEIEPFLVQLFLSLGCEERDFAHLFFWGIGRL